MSKNAPRAGANSTGIRSTMDPAKNDVAFASGDNATLAEQARSGDVSQEKRGPKDEDEDRMIAYGAN